ncbi:MAG: glycosyltransferase family 2 protein [Acidobacteriota bacterium]|nr:glycosyltransferase family 2 protein [Acidobacteriota bacterium]
MSCASILFWISLLYTLYIIGFYPLFVSWMARVRPMPVRRHPHTPSVSVIIATYNGEYFLKDKLDSVFSLDYPQELIQVIVVNDGSSDGTLQVARSYGGRIVLINSEKSGKAGALNKGMAEATGEILVFTDVRQRLAPESLILLMENFADPAVGTASAELQILAGSTSEEADTGTYWRYERWLRLNLSAIDSIFGASGSYYAVRRELAIPIPQHTLNDDMYLPLHSFFLGYRLIVDGRAKMYDYPTTLSAEFSRKVRTLAGNYQIIRYYPQLLGPKNRLLFHFLSYKLGRLLLPFALLLCAVSSLVAGGALTVISLVGQIGLYSAAVLDPRITPNTLLKRITSPIRSFLVMMIAALCAVSIWFVPAERFWKTTRVSRQNASPGNRT